MSNKCYAFNNAYIIFWEIEIFVVNYKKFWTCILPVTVSAGRSVYITKSPYKGSISEPGFQSLSLLL